MYVSVHPDDLARALASCWSMLNAEHLGFDWLPVWLLNMTTADRAASIAARSHLIERGYTRAADRLGDVIPPAVHPDQEALELEVLP